MQVLKSTYQYQNTISKNAKDLEDLKNFSQWNFLLSHFFTIEKEILSIEFQNFLLHPLIKDIKINLFPFVEIIYLF